MYSRSKKLFCQYRSREFFVNCEWNFIYLVFVFWHRKIWADLDPSRKINLRCSNLFISVYWILLIVENEWSVVTWKNEKGEGGLGITELRWFCSSEFAHLIFIWLYKFKNSFHVIMVYYRCNSYFLYMIYCIGGNHSY